MNVGAKRRWIIVNVLFCGWETHAITAGTDGRHCSGGYSDETCQPMCWLFHAHHTSLSGSSIAVMEPCWPQAPGTARTHHNIWGHGSGERRGGNGGGGKGTWEKEEGKEENGRLGMPFSLRQADGVTTFCSCSSHSPRANHSVLVDPGQWNANASCAVRTIGLQKKRALQWVRQSQLLCNIRHHVHRDVRVGIVTVGDVVKAHIKACSSGVCVLPRAVISHHRWWWSCNRPSLGCCYNIIRSLAFSFYVIQGRWMLCLW